MANILITGATGNIGEVLTAHLKKKHKLILVDIDFSESDKEIIEGTIKKELDLSVLRSEERRVGKECPV